MEKLDKKYQKAIDAIADSIQSSDQLNTYLDTEEYDDYKELVEAFEPQIQELYDSVAANDPLQLETLELALLDDQLEGLYMSKIVGYAVLRGELNESVKFRFPQDHFKQIILSLANSSNFDMIKQRVGLSIQIGFALSSDIWITNITEQITNRSVKYFLESQKLHKYRDIATRKLAVQRYQKQFQSLNFLTAEFPQTYAELKSKFYRLRTFLKHRISNDFENKSLTDHINAFISNGDLMGHDEYIRILTLLGMYFDLNAEGKKAFSSAFESMTKHDPTFSQSFMELLDELHGEDIGVPASADQNISALIKDHSTSELKSYYTLTDTIHGKGFVHDDSIKAVTEYYEQHEGLSVENECVRLTVLSYITKILNNLDVESYSDYFELNKTFVQYINIFGNQKFNQAVKEESLKYIKRLIKRYTDKRGRDYQDIKKFVKATFLDLGFMKEKELVELFKTKRKKTPAVS